MRTPENLRQSSHFTAADFGSPAQWAEFILEHPKRGKMPGKVFLGQTLQLTGMEVSLGSLEPGASAPFMHAHKQNEELYLFLSGIGEMQVDETLIPLRAGSAVRVAPAGVRAWHATGHEPLTFIVIQAKAESLEQATANDGILSDRALPWKGPN